MTPSFCFGRVGVHSTERDSPPILNMNFSVIYEFKNCFPKSKTNPDDVIWVMAGLWHLRFTTFNRKHGLQTKGVEFKSRRHLKRTQIRLRNCHCNQFGKLES